MDAKDQMGLKKGGHEIIHVFLNLALAIHVFSHFFACTIRSPLCTVRNSCEILKNGFLFMYTKGRLLVIFLVWCTQLRTVCKLVIKKILFKGAVQKGERERKKNCRFIVNHASKWRHHGSFQIFFTPPFPLDT